MMERDSKIFVAGHGGLAGSAILDNLRRKGYCNFVLRTRAELDLVDRRATAAFFESEKPEYVILAAAKVGGIAANNRYRAEFIYENLMIQSNVIHCSWLHGVRKLLFLGSSCIYPAGASGPIGEDELLTAPLEFTNEPYAIDKVAGIKMCESYNLQYGTDFITVMPFNIYGPNDNFDLERSHVIPALIRKMHLAGCLEKGDAAAVSSDLAARPVDGVCGESSMEEILNVLAKYGVRVLSDGSVEVGVWGSGAARREFLWSEDMADAAVYIMERVGFADLARGMNGAEIRNTHINVGTGKDISIAELASTVKKITGFGGTLRFETEMPEGVIRKVADPSKLHSLGWRHSVETDEGVGRLYEWYKHTIR
jgi:GDP-L-fucose synthase